MQKFELMTSEIGPPLYLIIEGTFKFGVSLGYLELESRDIVVIPRILFESSEDLIHLDKTRLIRVATKLDRIENQK